MARFARWTAMPALALACAAGAQTPSGVQDYQLPAGQPSPAQPVVGPVDPENPAPPRGAAARPAPSPAATPVAALPSPAPPTAQQTAGAGASPQPRATASRPPRTHGRAPAASFPPAPDTALPTAPAEALPPQLPAEPPATKAETPAPVASPEWPLLAAGGALALLLLGGAFYLKRRPRSAWDEAADEAKDRPIPTAEDEDETVAPGAIPVLDAPSPAAAAAALEISLEPQRMTRALVNATLSYRLSLTNHGSSAIGPIAIICDIVSAHGSLSEQEQLEPAGSEPVHTLGSLASGECVTLAGDLRLPLREVRPVRSGNAHLLVPLARFRVEAPSLLRTQVFVIGECPEQPGGKLKPFRLDDGPRVFSRLGQREVFAD